MNRDGWPWITGGFLVVGAGAIIAFVVPDEDVQRIATAVNVMLVGGLVLVTLHYAVSTRQMAREMRLQRQDAFLPIIDISRKPIELERAEAVLAAEKRNANAPDRWTCTLMNVGAGPALNVQYKIRLNNGETHTLTERALVAGKEFSPPGKLAISPRAEGDLPYLQVCYLDVFRRTFMSRKAILINSEQKRFELGPLEFKVAGVDYFDQGNPLGVKP